MLKTFHLTIAKVGENLFDGEAVSVSLPGEEGVFEILAGHEAFVSPLRTGEVRLTSAAGETRRYGIGQGGLVEVSRDQATVLL